MSISDLEKTFKKKKWKLGLLYEGQKTMEGGQFMLITHPGSVVKTPVRNKKGIHNRSKSIWYINESMWYTLKAMQCKKIVKGS